MNETIWLPLFPLKTVLFPGGVLPLRVFETRYVDMVRACMKTDTPFGVVAIRSGTEVGTAAEPYPVGTHAHIVEWDMPELGVLLLQTRGGQRFRILETRRQNNQLLEALTEPLIESSPDQKTDGGTDTDADANVSEASAASDNALAVCGRVLRVVIEELMERASAEAGGALVNPFPEPHQLDHAGWVANRWCEMLPIDLEEKQALLEITDDARRLVRVEQYLQQNGVL
jgi:Lon protease-like protein